MKLSEVAMFEDVALNQVLVAVGKLQGEVSGVSRQILDLGSQLSDLKVSVNKDLATNSKEIGDLKISLGIFENQLKSVISVTPQVQFLTTQVDRLTQESDKRSRMMMLVITPLITTLVLGLTSLSWWVISHRVLSENSTKQSIQGSR